MLEDQIQIICVLVRSVHWRTLGKLLQAAVGRALLPPGSALGAAVGLGELQEEQCILVGETLKRV